MHVLFAIDKIYGHYSLLGNYDGKPPSSPAHRNEDGGLRQEATFKTYSDNAKLCYALSRFDAEASIGPNEFTLNYISTFIKLINKFQKL